MEPVSRKQRIDHLYNLFSPEEQGGRSKLSDTVHHIENNIKKSTRTRRFRSDSLYLHPKVDNVGYHVLVTNRKSKDPRIYILPKTKEIGEGIFKVVRIGFDYHTCTRVASATLKENVEEAKKEFKLLKRFGVALDYGVYSHEKQKKVKIIMRLGNMGNLESLIYPENRSCYQQLSREQRIELLTSMLSEVKKIHESDYVIADLKVPNIVWNQDNKGHIKAFICDMGLSYHITEKNKRLRGTPQTIAPEIVEKKLGLDKTIGKPVDIFALGFILWSVFVGGTPPWLKICERLAISNMSLLEPTFYESCWDAFKAPVESLEFFIHQMMHPDQKKRPEIKKVLANLGGKDPQELLDKKCGGIRLMSHSETIQSIKLFLSDIDERNSEYLKPLTSYYFLSEDKEDENSVMIVYFTNEEGEYSEVSLRNDVNKVKQVLAWLGSMDCLNYWQYI